MDQAFFCNSGTEANEAAIKLARKWGRKHKGSSATQIVTLTHGFHGRTLGSLAATAKPQYQTSFEPLPGGFVYVSSGESRALDAAITDKTCAVLLEPVQGEGGVHVLSSQFLLAARKLCDERNALLIADEVQCGLGRTGRFLASEHAGILPDVVTLAKGIANGVPMGACLARGTAAEVLEPGDHGCTFGGNPLSCAAARATLDAIQDEHLISNARVVGEYLLAKLENLAADFPILINEVRGLGLMIGIEMFEAHAKQISRSLLGKGVVVGTAGDNVIRLLPPLIIDHADCDEFLQTFELVLAEMTAKEIL